MKKIFTTTVQERKQKSSTGARKWLYRNYGLLVVCLLILTYSRVFVSVTVRRHRSFGTHAYDLANMDQAVWNTLQGRILYLSTVGWTRTRLAIHFEPILILLSPLYLLYQNAEILLIVQTIALALGALPVYLFALRKIGFQWIAVIFSLVYLLYPPMQAANNYDFHAVALAIPLLLSTFYFLEEDRLRLALLFAVLAMMCKENVPLVVVMLGVYRMVFRRDLRGGIVLCFIGGLWFLLAFGLIIPYFVRNTALQYDYSSYHSRYAHLGSGPIDIMLSLVRTPGKWIDLLTSRRRIIYVRDLLLPLALFPMLAPHVFLISFPVLAINVLSGYSAQHLAFEYHYASNIVPFAVLSSVVAVDWVTRSFSERLDVKREWLLLPFIFVLLISSFVIHYYMGYSPLAVNFSWPQINERTQLGNEMLDLIPLDAVVSAQSDLAPHLSHREHLYVFPTVNDAEYVALDINSTIFPVETYGEYVAHIESLLSSNYGVVFAQDGYLLLSRGEKTDLLPRPFFSFAFPLDEDLENMRPRETTFCPGLTLAGYQVQQTRNAVIRLIVYWKVEFPLEEPLHTALYIRDRANCQITRGPILSRTESWIPLADLTAGEYLRVDYGWFSVPVSPVPEVGVTLRNSSTDMIVWSKSSDVEDCAELHLIVPLVSFDYDKGYLFER